MEKTFNPVAIESKWYSFWEQNQLFRPASDTSQLSDTEGVDPLPYCIMIPPPNVTGSLHMGHAFQQTLMDALIRFKRMGGQDVLWQVGTDHAGIATQMVVERQLLQENKGKPLNLSRETLIDKIWQWKQQSGNKITSQMRRLGTSVDWQRERFTLDQGLSDAVRKVFVQLYREGLIYNGKRLVNWDPKLKSAISDLEIENPERQGFLWHFHYPLADSTEADEGTYLTIATTRPETMLGDTAVAVHPDDTRYQHLIGRRVALPLVNRLIPIIADSHVDPKFGSGCVKVTPAHDFNDYEIGQRHRLPLINIFDATASTLTAGEVLNSDGSKNSDLKAEIPSYLQKLDRFQVRKLLVAKMESIGLLKGTEPHRLTLPIGDRSGAVIEPLLTDQWYLKTKQLAKRAIEAVDSKAVEFIPASYDTMYFNWMREIQDWCISRQLWWGHRIPAWYDEQGKLYVGLDEQEVRDSYRLGDLPLRQDKDVLDTWFSSALWTFATLGWPKDTADMRRFHPTSVLVTGFDIIFFWVARMIMMTLHFTDQVPFHKVYITGLIRDERGQKMSKSKGNVIDPLDMIDGISLNDLIAKRTSNMLQPQLGEKIAQSTRKQYPKGIEAHGTDALRFTLVALASSGRDINWDMQRLKGYRNFCNKLWNASRYVLMSTRDLEACTKHNPKGDISNRWINARLNHYIEMISAAFDDFRFDRIANLLQEFIWHEYCDWYLELSKPLLVATDQQLRAETAGTLIRVLEQILRLAHPIIPFITEEIWQTLKPLFHGQQVSIMLAPYPMASAQNQDAEAVARMSWIQQLVTGIRSIRSENSISPALRLKAYCRNGSPKDRQLLEQHQQCIINLAHLESISWLQDKAPIPPLSATAIVDNLEVLIPIEGLVDIEKESSRLHREIAKLKKRHQLVSNKLNQPTFIEQAPKTIVAEERLKLQAIDNRLAILSKQMVNFQPKASQSSQ